MYHNYWLIMSSKQTGTFFQVRALLLEVKKSGRYNTTDTTSLSPQFCWPNEGLITVQMAASMRDAVSLPWPVVSSALAISMTATEEGWLGWADSMKWSLNRISSSQLAMHNTQSVAASGSKVRTSVVVAKTYNHQLISSYCVHNDNTKLKYHAESENLIII